MAVRNPAKSMPQYSDLQDKLLARSPKAVVTWLLIATNALVFLAMLASGGGLWHSHNGIQLAWGANFGPATQDGQWWRLASAMFLHFGLFHLLMNLWALWDGGQLVERIYGRVRFLVIYFLSGLVGNLLSLVTQGNQAVSGGASGAIFGVYGALLIVVWRERHSLSIKDFRWFFWGVSGFSTASILLGFVIQGIDNSAHVGGLLAGMLISTALTHPQRQHAAWPLAERIGACMILGGAIGALITQIPEPTYRWHEELAARAEINQFLHEDMQIQQKWQRMLRSDSQHPPSFQSLAEQFDSEVADFYDESLEHLSALPLSPNAPSAASISQLRDFARQRRDASRAIADQLRLRERFGPPIPSPPLGLPTPSAPPRRDH